MISAKAGPSPAPARSLARRGGSVVLYGSCRADLAMHEAVCHAAIARQLADLLRADYAGEHAAGRRYDPPVYFVPSDVVVGLGKAAALGIRSELDLFGGVVPHAVVATKAISHPVVAADAVVPIGWSHDFPEQVAGATLPGYSAFSLEDALRAGQALLQRGPVRLKPAWSRGGLFQCVVHDGAELETALRAQPGHAPLSSGMVLEPDLIRPITYSVGEVRVAGTVLAYHGTQRQTVDNRGEVVYGGSDLHVHRGRLDTLLESMPSSPLRNAILQAHTYDHAVHRCFPSMYASRRNYDVLQGMDHAGHFHSGVLESSWRIGGASGAEVAALLHFRDNPDSRSLHARTVEAYGRWDDPPAGANILFQGTDPDAGRLTIYASADTWPQA